MTEAQFCTRLRKSFEALGHWAYKIPDAPVFKGMNTKFNRERPYDIELKVGRHSAAIECKMLKKPLANYTFKQFQALFTDSQVKHMTAIQKKGGQCFAFVCYQQTSWKASERIHEVYVIPWRRVMKGYWMTEAAPLEVSKQLYNVQDFCKYVINGTYSGV